MLFSGGSCVLVRTRKWRETSGKRFRIQRASLRLDHEFEQTQCSGDGGAEWEVAEPQNRLTVVLSCLTRYWAAYQRQQANAASHAAEACAEDRALSSSCTWNRSLAPCTQNQKTRMELELELEHQNLFRSKGSTVGVPYHKWPSSKVLQSSFSLPVLLHTCSHKPLKPNPNLGSGSSSFWALASYSSVWHHL